MSLHNDPNYQIPALVAALKHHCLTHDTPSQLADSFRTGWVAAIAAAPAQDDDALTAAYMAGRYDAKKAARAAAQPVAVVASKLGDICSFRSSVARKGDVVYFQPPAQAQDAHKPLTDAEVSSVYFEVLGTVRIQDPTLINRLVRAIESVHGIR